MRWIGEGSMTNSALQSEAQALELAAEICHDLKMEHQNLLTDSQVLTEAAARRHPSKNPWHWTIRPNLHQFIFYT